MARPSGWKTVCLSVSMALAASLAGVDARSTADAVAVAKSILVTVLDEAGAPLRDLRPSEFIVTEDGTPREVIDARPYNEPLYVALLVDTARPAPGVQFPTQELRRGVTTFSRRVLDGTAGSQIVVMDLAQGGSIVVPYTSDFRKIKPWADRLVESQQGAGVLLEALVTASRDLMAKDSPRRAIVSLTFDGPESSALTPQSVAETVIKSGAAYWPVTIRGISGIRPSLVPLRDTLFSNLPAPSGGLHVNAVSPTALEAILGKVGAALTSQYEVTYARPNGIPAKVIQASAKRGAKVLRASWIR